MAKVNFKYEICKEGKYYVAQSLDLEISSFGETRKKALENLKEAVELYNGD